MGDPQTLDKIRSRLAGLGNQTYWRSLEEAAASPEFEEYLHKEFPSQLPVWSETHGRRGFLKLMAASLSLAGIAGCTREPKETIVPYVRSPEHLVPGKPLYYASAIRRGGYAQGVLVESHLGRPTKIEGNPEHPVNRGGSDTFMQAAILSLYDPDRSQTILHRGKIETYDTFVSEMNRELVSLRGTKGRGLRILTETVTSPTLARQLTALIEALPEARWHVYEPAGQQNAQAGSQLAFGDVVSVLPRFEKAAVVVSLDCDFLAGQPGSVQFAREFINRRRAHAGTSEMNRLYVAESTVTITGAMADHRVALRPSLFESLAREILRQVRGDAAGAESLDSSIPGEWVSTVVSDLQKNQGASLVLAGSGQPPAVQALAHAINAALGNAGKTVDYVAPVDFRPESPQSTLADLLADIDKGGVSALLMLGGNPVYSARGAVDFAGHLAKVPLRIHLSDSYDETSFLCDWHIPEAHDLESWSDARSHEGTVSIIQPLISPLYQGKTAHEILSLLLGAPDRSSYEIVQETWKAKLGDGFERGWRKALHDGFIADSQSAPVSVTLTTGEIAPAKDGETVGTGALEIEFRPDPTIFDGRYANNAWLQELPKPVTKITWDNVAYVSPATATRLGLENENLIRVGIGERQVSAPVWILPGQPDDCISVTLGYGRTRAGRVGSNIGFSAYEILPVGAAWFTTGNIAKTTDHYPLATTQTHHSMEGRDIVRVTTRNRLEANPNHLHEAHHHPDPLPTFYPEPNREGNQWAMVIDQTACIGCTACVVACQAENNIPVVGKEQVIHGREMHWLRIDRYYHGPLDSPEIYFQPMMCSHCESAPCEVVCPVAATVHDSEGTSNMVYNRCVGTRYCSNNCPYKVRRFNFLQFSDMETESLKLMRNPDVTVRPRGVMEKCSYCIQRVNLARIDAKTHDREIVLDTEIQSACQQACPTGAIVFGNLNDPNGRLKPLKESPLNYGVLAELNTRPRTTYLARVTNPHPDLPAPLASQPEGHAADQHKAHT